MDLMTIDEMRQHKWRVSWSGGKDSTATIILMHENDVPIDRIVYVRMMFDDELPATLPVMTDFVDKTIDRLKEWGYEVEVVKSKKSAYGISEQVYKRSVHKASNGAKYGISGFCRGACVFQQEKPKAINSIAKADYEMIGYASDETERLERLGGGRQSIMVALGIEEKQAFEICRKYDMLSPLYETGVGRDGCFFCPNAGVLERRLLEQEHPELVQKIYEMIDKTCCQAVLRLQYRNNWIKDYLKNNGDFKKPEEMPKDNTQKEEKQLDGQVNIFDWLESEVIT